MLDDNKVAFIIWANHQQYYEECVRYLRNLIIPDDIATELLCVTDVPTLAEAYQEGMLSSDARYKVYIRENIFLLNRNFFSDLLQIFAEDERIGMVGMTSTLAPTDNLILYDGHDVRRESTFQQGNGRLYEGVDALTGLLLATCVDLPWEEGEDTVQKHCTAMREAGLRLVVPVQERPWCYYDFILDLWSKDVDSYERILSGFRQLFAQGEYGRLLKLGKRLRVGEIPCGELREMLNILEIYRMETSGSSRSHSFWYGGASWNELSEYYRQVRFLLLRIEYGRCEEDIHELRELVENGGVSHDAVRILTALNLTNAADVREKLLEEATDGPLVSVVVCVHNAEDILSETIESVLTQTYRNYELLLVDDASTDGSRRVIESYQDERIRPIYLEKNRHICNAGNVGFAEARGEYVAALGHDDVMYPEKLRSQVAFLEEHPEVVGCFAWGDIIDEYGVCCNREFSQLYKMFRCDNRSAGEWLGDLIRYGNCLLAPSCCIRRSALEKAGHYRYGLVQSQDYDLWMRLLWFGDIYVLREPLIGYRRFRKAGRNISGTDPAQLRRTVHEAQWIWHEQIMHMPSERFKEAFAKQLRNPQASSEKEITCERVLYLWERQNLYAQMDFMKLLEDEECRRILEEEYGIGLKDFYQQNGEKREFER